MTSSPDNHEEESKPTVNYGGPLLALLVVATVLLVIFVSFIGKMSTGDPARNAEAMVAFTHGLPDGFEFTFGKNLIGPQSFTVMRNTPSITCTVTALPSSSAKEGKLIVDKEISSRGWVGKKDLTAPDTRTVGNEQMYFVMKKHDDEALQKTTDYAEQFGASNQQADGATSVKVVYATRDIEQGEIISADALQERDTQAKDAPTDAFNSAVAVTGQQARQPISAGAFVSAHAVTAKVIPDNAILLGGIVTNNKKILIEAKGVLSDKDNMYQLNRFFDCIQSWR